jgi:Flp pilus assembly protein TadB
MIPYSIKASIQGDKLYNWSKISGLINIRWGCTLFLLSIATLGFGNGYIWIFVLVTFSTINIVTTYKNNRKNVS